MKRAIILALALSGCTGLRDQINCGNGAHLRAAAVKTIETIDRACLIPAPAQ